ncbi:shikimate dehydrogenase [Thalassobaculum sp. OXR-137]|uniref:shikimate dehydrogenase family protein n=1 Tax=Thalassobaculum sp. OXR-137 TaxID=3100173 RepID=UPI002AC9592F|nr:shikimate dehydrogenase [Thalassobaculum sp. OXR-137]WPZ32319.1 shikimate dehydrogenase [Thalassobaculum sp. OXR-137]
MTFAGPIDNRIEITTAQYAAILGATPSKGARSPLLWNAAFKVAGIDAMMYPMDTTPDHLGAVVAALKADPRFVGGAVAVPHKQAVGAFLDRLEPEAARIGAVNAIYRDGDALVGANTDGAGALSQIEILVGGADVLKTKRATLIGLGGAGLAVAAYLAGRTASLTVANRTRATADAASQKLGAVAVDYPLSPEVLEATDLLVNATTVGHPDGPEGSPVPENLLAALPEGAAVYDVIYQPSPTPLLAAAQALGHATDDGLGMNLDQAVIAFGKALPGALPVERIREAMRAA